MVVTRKKVGAVKKAAPKTSATATTVAGGIGQKVGSMAALKKTLAKKQGGNAWIKRVPKNDDITVRFLTEPDEFVQYEECWDGKQSFPFIEGMVEGTDFMRKSTVFLANVLDVENDRVIALQVKMSVLNSLVIKYERVGTLMDRDYVIGRRGEGKQTEYDVSPEAPSKRNLAKYTPLDLGKVLQDAADDSNDAVVEDVEGEEEIQPVKKAGSTGRARPRPVAAEHEEEEAEDEPEPEADDDEWWSEEDMMDKEATSWAELKEYARDVVGVDPAVIASCKGRGALVPHILVETGQED